MRTLIPLCRDTWDVRLKHGAPLGLQGDSSASAVQKGSCTYGQSAQLRGGGPRVGLRILRPFLVATFRAFDCESELRARDARHMAAAGA